MTVIFAFEGGGWCYDLTPEGTLNDCLRRSKSDLGSSSKYPATAGLGGILSRKESDNKYFYDASAIFVKYCDGTGNFLKKFKG